MHIKAIAISAVAGAIDARTTKVSDKVLSGEGLEGLAKLPILIVGVAAVAKFGFKLPAWTSLLCGTAFVAGVTVSHYSKTYYV